MAQSLPMDPSLPVAQPLPGVKPGQILVLAAGDGCLYGEVVDLVPQRQRVWLRTLLLTLANPLDPDRPSLYLLQEDSHLLWPLALFQPALDTDLLPLLPHLIQTQRTPLTPEAAQAFRQFIAQVWHHNPSAFQS